MGKNRAKKNCHKNVTFVTVLWQVTRKHQLWFFWLSLQEVKSLKNSTFPSSRAQEVIAECQKVTNNLLKQSPFEPVLRQKFGINYSKYNFSRKLCCFLYIAATLTTRLPLNKNWLLRICYIDNIVVTSYLCIYVWL